jgi:hypothetical protein
LKTKTYARLSRLPPAVKRLNSGEWHQFFIRLIDLFFQTKTKVMEKLEVKCAWNQVNGKLKQKYAQFTDDDLAD